MTRLRSVALADFAGPIQDSRLQLKACSADSPCMDGLAGLKQFFLWAALPAFGQTVEHRTLFPDAIFTENRQAVVYVQRDMSALVPESSPSIWGEPPVQIKMLGDDVSIRKINLASGEITILKQFPPTPVAKISFEGGKHFERDNGIIVEMGWSPMGELQYSLIAPPDRRVIAHAHRIDGRRLLIESWEPFHHGYDYGCGSELFCGKIDVDKNDMDKLSGNLELGTDRIIDYGSLYLLNYEDHSVRVLAGKQIKIDYAFQWARRKEIEEQNRSDLVTKYRLFAQNHHPSKEQTQAEMTKIGATQEEIDDTLRIEGLLPPQGSNPHRAFTAELVRYSDVQDKEWRFQYDVTDADFKEWLDPLVQKAFLHPGQEMQAPWGFNMPPTPNDASRLNELIAAHEPPSSALVRYGGRYYKVTIVKK